MRVTWVDRSKGFAIILVVFGHVWRGLESAGLLQPDLFRAVDARIYAFHMPLFFLLAGLFFAGSLRKLSPGKFLQSRGIRLIYPLLLWTYIFIGFKLAAGSLSNSPIGVEELFISPIPGRWHFWFLWALFIIHIAMLLVKPLVVSDRLSPLGLVAILLGSVLLMAADLPKQVDLWVGPAILHLPYFALGMIIGKTCFGIKIPAWGAGLSAVIFALLLVFFPRLWGAGVPFLVTASLLSLSALAVFIWLDNKGGPVLRGLCYIGERSMPIFLAHIIFTAGIREVLMKFGTDGIVLHLILGTALGVILPIIMYDLAGRLKLVKVFGF